ncbi:MAG: bifunctional DNA primase/polymerase [Candidatus Nealsonbacteria bacterium]|nr:bifunctional DNA primase/polymerase [Candidatus Nealsonbacteria bacterium]
MQDAAIQYATHGYTVFPLAPGLKRPHKVLAPNGVHGATGDEATVRRWFSRAPSANIGLACEGLFVVDCDPGNTWPGFERLRAEAACPVQNTPRGGVHFVFRRPEGKSWRNSQSGVATKIDTRTDGGYIVADPSHTIDCPEENTVEGDYRFESPLPPLVELPFPPDWLVEELDAAFAPKPASLPPSPSPATQNETDITERAIAYMAECPPAISGQGGHPQTFKVAQALVNGFCLEPGVALRLLREHYNPRCEPPWSEKELQHKVDSAQKHPADKPTGWLRDHSLDSLPGNAADISGLVSMAATPRPIPADIEDDEPDKPEIPDPGPTPVELLRVPGFIGEVMDHCLETAPYPNPVMAFCGALTLQAFLGGRRVRDSGDNRTNIYLLGLAHSAAGKDWPRKINTQIAHAAGLADCLGDRFASGEGVQDALFANPTMLFQTDEIDGMLQSINRSKDARYENLMGTLLTLFSASASVFPMRPKAGKESPGVIDQPCLTIFGTAIPNHYYDALSERMLTNGFFARMIILEAGRRGKGQEPSIREVPMRVVETARWWADFQPGQGNLKNWHPVPAIVEQTESAKKALIATREEAEAEYAHCDPVGTTVWGRVSEQTRKLALLYAISEDYQRPRIGKDAVSWASRLVVHQTQRMLAMAEGHVAENPFHAECLKLLQKLRDAREGQLLHSILLKRMKVKSREFTEMIETLVQRGDVERVPVITAGRTGLAYRLAAGERRVKEDL